MIQTSSLESGPVGRASRPLGMRVPPIGFTLIEVLVVVATIALLVSILLPSLSKARETAKRTMCIAHLHQQGIGFSSYSADNRAKLPWAAKFRYALLEGLYYHGFPKPQGDAWAPFNSGALFPKYVGKTADVFYCPSNLTFNARNPDNGMAVFLRIFYHQSPSDPAYVNSHNFPISPYYSYQYALPAANTCSPRDAGANMYPLDTVQTDSPYYKFLNDPQSGDPSFLGPSEPRMRGKHNVHALLSDGFYYDGNLVKPALGYHGGSYSGGYNVLYSDYHVKWVVDPGGKIHTSPSLSYPYSAYGGIDSPGGKVYRVWDYFSRSG